MKTATAELTSSRTQMQRGKPLMVTGSCHLRIEPRGNITEHTSLNCFLLLTLTRKHGFPSSELLHTLKHFASKKNRPCEDIFVKCSSFCLFSLFTSKRCMCNSQKYRHFNAMLYFSIVFLLLRLYVSTHLQVHLREAAASPVCVCVVLRLACVTLSDHCIRFSGHHRDSPHAPWI